MLEFFKRIALALEAIAANTKREPKKEEPPSKCRYCGTEIHWGKYGKKSFPLNLDGTAHHCEEYEAAKAKEASKE